MNIDFVFQRKEDKYLVHASSITKLKDEFLRGMPRADEHEYRILSTYFDNNQWLCYTNHVLKILPRFKIRFRQYGDHEGFCPQGFLEMKEKNNEFTAKHRFWVNQQWQDMYGESIIIDKLIALNYAITDSSLAPTYRRISALVKDEVLRPVIQVDYVRISLEDSIQDIRITFDRNVKFRAIASFGIRPVRNIEVLPDEFVIMEIKSKDSHPEWLKDILQNHAIRKHAFSKFAMGVASLYEPMIVHDSDQLRHLQEVNEKEVLHAAA